MFIIADPQNVVVVHCLVFNNFCQMINIFDTTNNYLFYKTDNLIIFNYYKI